MEMYMLVIVDISGKVYSLTHEGRKIAKEVAETEMFAETFEWRD